MQLNSSILNMQRKTNKIPLCTTSFYFWKLHLHTKTSAILNLSYLAFCSFVEMNLFCLALSIFFCILYLVLRARSVRRLLVCCMPKLLLFYTSAIWHVSYLAPLLFGTSTVWHLSYLWLVVIFV